MNVGEQGSIGVPSERAVVAIERAETRLRNIEEASDEHKGTARADLVKIQRVELLEIPDQRVTVLISKL